MASGSPGASEPAQSEPAVDRPRLGHHAFRAYRLGADGSVIEAKSAPSGILKVPAGGFERVFEQEIGPWLAGQPDLPAIAAGMIGSRQGWVEAPYALPGGSRRPRRRARGARPGAGGRLVIIPGVARDGEVPDVMRGEETQIAGDGLPDARAVYLLPGTHSKWALVEGGRIVWFTTFMTGELFAALSEHTILARLMTAAPSTRTASRAGSPRRRRRGCWAGCSRRARFVFRPAAGPRHRVLPLGPSYRSRDPRGPRGTGWAAGASLPEIGIIGRHDLADAYRRALAGAGLAAREAAAATTAGGLLAIARAAGLVKGPA